MPAVRVSPPPCGCASARPCSGSGRVSTGASPRRCTAAARAPTPEPPRRAVHTGIFAVPTTAAGRNPSQPPSPPSPHRQPQADRPRPRRPAAAQNRRSARQGSRYGARTGGRQTQSRGRAPTASPPPHPRSRRTAARLPAGKSPHTPPCRLTGAAPASP